jgi:hypothetical protein
VHLAFSWPRVAFAYVDAEQLQNQVLVICQCDILRPPSSDKAREAWTRSKLQHFFIFKKRLAHKLAFGVIAKEPRAKNISCLPHDLTSEIVVSTGCFESVEFGLVVSVLKGDLLVVCISEHIHYPKLVVVRVIFNVFVDTHNN